MKETYSDKVKIYEHRKQVQSFAQHSKKFTVNVYVLSYMIRLIRLIKRYRIEIVKGGNTVTTPHQFLRE